LDREKPEKQQRYCGNCGAPVAAQTSFCTSCGERLVPEGRYLTLVEGNSTQRDDQIDARTQEPSNEVPAIESAGSDLQRHNLELLAAYNETLDLYDRLPHIVWVRKNQGLLGRFLMVPRWRWPLRYFLAHHMARTLALLKRRFYADTAISGDSDVSRVEREVVENFQQTLPPIPYKRLILGFSFVVFLLASLMFGGRQDAILNKVPSAAFEVATSPQNIASPQDSEVGKLFGAAGKDPASAFTVALTLVILFWVGLTVVVSGFKLKRMLFNLYPLEGDSLLSTSDVDHRARCEGVYMLEARLFSELGMSPPYEPPFDLLVSVPIRILSLLWAVVAIFGGIASIFLGVIIKNDPLLRLGFYILAVLLIVIGLPVLVGSIVALVRSALTWRRRKARLRELWTASG
jgi:hypothetical protein